MWYHTAALAANGTAQFASAPFVYDAGLAPRIALAGPTILEVHQAEIGPEVPLWYHTGAY